MWAGGLSKQLASTVRTTNPNGFTNCVFHADASPKMKKGPSRIICVVPPIVPL
ncbi:MAG: hypothetical protein ACRD8K_03365 [Nitrososphaeraceae archaeon]